MNIKKNRFLLILIFSSNIFATEIHSLGSIEIISNTENKTKTDELSQGAKGQTLGDYLENKLFVNSATYGPAVGRPVIKGMDGYRLGITKGLVSINDFSSMSHDHAVGTMPKTSEKIEYIKGSSSLLYGNYSGGVVKVISQENDPRFISNQKKLEIEASKGFNGAGDLYGMKGEYSNNKIAVHVNAFSHKAKDYKDGNSNKIKDSDTSSKQGHLVVSYKLNDSNIIKAYGDKLNKEYGIPNTTSRKTSIDMEQKSYGIVLHSRKVLGIDYMQTQIQKSEYLHTEYEGESPDGLFGQDQKSINNIAHFNKENHFIKTSIEYSNSDLKVCHDHGRCNNFEDSERTSIEDGFEIKKNIKRFSLPFSHGHPMPNIKENVLKLGIHTKSILNDSFELDFSLRKEFRKLKTNNKNIQEEWLITENVDKNYYKNINNDAFSSSLGLTYLNDNLTIESVFSYIQRLPASSELFWNGFHHATNSYILGNRYLENEKSKNIDLDFTYERNTSTSKLNTFYYDFDNYIFQKPSKDLKDPFHNTEVWMMEGLKAKVYGLALKQSLKSSFNDHNFINTISYEYIEGKLDEGGNIPRISPQNITLQSEYAYKKYKANVKYKYVFESRNEAENETATPSYSWVSLLLSYTNKTKYGKYNLYLKGENLTNQQAYNHISFLKKTAPLAGRQLSIGMKIEF